MKHGVKTVICRKLKSAVNVTYANLLQQCKYILIFKVSYLNVRNKKFYIIKSPAIRRFVWRVVWTNVKEHMTASHHWAFVRRIQRSSVDSLTKGPMMRKAFPCDDVISNPFPCDDVISNPFSCDYVLTFCYFRERCVGRCGRWWRLWCWCQHRAGQQVMILNLNLNLSSTTSSPVGVTKHDLLLKLLLKNSNFPTWFILWSLVRRSLLGSNDFWQRIL